MKSTVDNGCCRSNTGYRQVAISPTGEISPVWHAQRSGYRPDRCTIQLAAMGDYVVRGTWDRDDIEWETLVVSPSGLEPVVETAAPQLPDALADWVEAGQTGRQESYLPAGFGWDGKSTLSARRKEERIRRLFSGAAEDWIDRVVFEASYSPASGLPCRWHEAKAMPDIIDAPAHSWTGSVVDIDQSTEWLIWHSFGAVEHIRPAATSGEWGSNWAHSDRGEYSAEPQEMPETAVKAIRIEWEPYTRTRDGGQYSWGIRWQIYSRSTGGKK